MVVYFFQDAALFAYITLSFVPLEMIFKLDVVVVVRRQGRVFIGPESDHCFPLSLAH